MAAEQEDATRKREALVNAKLGGTDEQKRTKPETPVAVSGASSANDTASAAASPPSANTTTSAAASAPSTSGSGASAGSVADDDELLCDQWDAQRVSRYLQPLDEQVAAACVTHNITGLRLFELTTKDLVEKLGASQMILRRKVRLGKSRFALNIIIIIISVNQFLLSAQCSYDPLQKTQSTAFFLYD